MCACVFSHRQLFVTPWTVVQQAPLSVGFPRQEYWSGLPFPPPGDLFHPGIEFMPPGSPTLAGRFFTSWAIREALTKSPKSTFHLCSACPSYSSYRSDPSLPTSKLYVYGWERAWLLWDTGRAESCFFTTILKFPLHSTASRVGASFCWIISNFFFRHFNQRWKLTGLQPGFSV